MPVDSTDRELEKQYATIALYADMGKEIDYHLDTISNSKPNRQSSDIQDAKQSIELPHDKLYHATSWFWESAQNTVDEMAFEQIKNGDINKAIQFWNSETEKGISAANKSNFKNLSTLLLASAIENDKFNKFHFMNGVSLLGDFLDGKYYDEFSVNVLGKGHSVDLKQISNLIIDEILKSIKPFIGARKSENKITKSELINCFKKFPNSLQNDISEKFIGDPIRKIEERIKNCKNDRESGEFSDGGLGYDLWKASSKELKEIQAVLSKSDLKYQLIADKLAEELLGCSISHFNRNYDSDSDPGEVSLELLNYAKKIAVGDKTKNRITDNQPTIEEFVASKSAREKLKPVKNEIDYIYRRIDELDNFDKIMTLADDADSLLRDCKPKLNHIRSHLGGFDEIYTNACDNVVQCALNACVTVANTASHAAEENESFMDAFFHIHYPVIVKVFNDAKKFTMSPHVKEYHSRNYKILRIGDHPDSKNGGNYNPRSPDYGSNNNTSSDGGCYIATMVYGSYDSNEVLVLRKFRDRFLQKYGLGKIFINVYYKYSPYIVKKTKNLKFFHAIIRFVLNQYIKIIRRVYD